MTSTNLASENSGDLPLGQVKTCVSDGGTLALTVTPVAADVDLIDWARANQQFIEAGLAKHGALLFRGFPVRGADEFEELIETISGELIEYHERSSPRSLVRGRIYTSTDHPARLSIFPHNEQSYNETFPLRISFYCQQPAARGGATPIGDTRRVFQHLDPRIRERFMQKKYMYVRNYGTGLGLTWQNVFQTGDRGEVERYCRASGIEFEWRGPDSLRTTQIRPAAARHPKTGEWVWFNHATFFHVSTLEPGLREALLEAVGEDELPNNTCYGDGSAIEPWVLDELRAAYLKGMTSFAWQEGDILLLDNMLTAHGRQPFEGPRKVLTAMAEPWSWENVEI